LVLNQWRFRQADGTVLQRWTGPAFVYAAGRTTTDEVVFGDPGDLVLLGARSLEGLNLRVDPLRKRLVDAGPGPGGRGDLEAGPFACRPPVDTSI